MRRGSHHASWRTHAALLALVGGYTALSASHSTPDANIGLGLGLLGLQVLGAPWSFVLVFLVLDGVAVDFKIVLAASTAAAMVNLALHAFLVGWTVQKSR